MAPNPYQFETVCDLCGGPGMGTLAAAAQEWIAGADIYHVNTAVCRYYLDKKEREWRELQSQAE